MTDIARVVAQDLGGRELQARATMKLLDGSAAALGDLDPARFVGKRFGESTGRDILPELEKPGLDPRPEFAAAKFREGAETRADSRPGMPPGIRPEGAVSNVARFGAFGDIDAHQDELFHISKRADRRVAARPGQVAKASVVEGGIPRKRILSPMRSGEEAGGREPPRASTAKAAPKTAAKADDTVFAAAVRLACEDGA